MRPHWDDVYVEMAAAISKRSLCSRAQVGAVIADRSHRIVAASYNGPAANFDHRDEQCESWCERGRTGVAGTLCFASHAEANAITTSDKSLWQGGTIYVTGDVCWECTRLIANSGLARVVVKLDGEDRSYRNSDESYHYLRSLGIGVEVWPAR